MSAGLAISPDVLPFRRRTHSRIPTGTEERAFRDLVRRLVARRVSIRVTQDDLNHELGVADGLIAKWETFARIPSAGMLALWCEALGVTLIPVGFEEM